ncbi:MAG: AMP-binding protein [Verrucomicrobiota bacterium]
MAEYAPRADGPVIARTGDAGFFVEILRAWRDGQAVVPIEKNATAPVFKMPVPAGACLVKYTAGAAGVPRGIWFGETAVAADAERIVSAMGLRREVPALGVVSLAHSYGFGNVVLPLLLHGVPVVLATAPFPGIVDEAFQNAGGEMTVAAVPPMWRAWLRSGILPDLPIALAVSAGSPLTLDLEVMAYSTAGLKIHNFYGASECGAIAWDATGVPRTDGRDVGTPMPGVLVSSGENGRLLVESDATGCGYDEERPDDTLANSRYLTRDIGVVSADGRVLLQSTSGGAINVAGRKVSPAKVEHAIFSTGLVKRVKVCGFPSVDPERHEEISATIQLIDGATLAGLRSRVVDLLPLWEVPRRWQQE